MPASDGITKRYCGLAVEKDRLRGLLDATLSVSNVAEAFETTSGRFRLLSRTKSSWGSGPRLHNCAQVRHRHLGSALPPCPVTHKGKEEASIPRIYALWISCIQVEA